MESFLSLPEVVVLAKIASYKSQTATIREANMYSKPFVEVKTRVYLFFKSGAHHLTVF